MSNIQNGGDYMRSSLAHFTLPEDTIKRADETLCRTIDLFVKELGEVERYVFCSRYSYTQPYETLQEVGDSLFALHGDGAHSHIPKRTKAYTRERIRQIQVSTTQRLREMLDHYNEVLRSVIVKGYDLLNGPFLPKLQERIIGAKHNAKYFNRFLAAISGFEEAEIDALYAGDLKGSMMDVFWVTYPPNSKHVGVDQLKDITAFLTEQYDMTVLQARNYVYHAFENDTIRMSQKTGRIEPCNLSKAYAFSHSTHAFPEGASWKRIQGHVNDLAICAKKLSTTRLDYGAGFAVDHGWIYQSSRGEYAPVEKFYQSISPDMVDQCLSILKSILIKDPGYIDAVPLSVVFAKHEKDIGISDYFVLRHLVRHCGETHGIFFSGVSGADMVSLHSEIETQSKQDTILKAFSDGRTFKVEDVTPLLRSQSSRHASYLIDCLIRDGRIVKVAKGVYACTNDRNDDIHISAVMKVAIGYLKGRPGQQVSYDVLHSYLTKMMGDTGITSSSHLVSIVRSSYKRFPGEWQFASNYVSYTPPVTGLL